MRLVTSGVPYIHALREPLPLLPRRWFARAHVAKDCGVLVEVQQRSGEAGSYLRNAEVLQGKALLGSGYEEEDASGMQDVGDSQRHSVDSFLIVTL